MGKSALATTVSAILVLAATAPGCWFTDGSSGTSGTNKKTLPDGAPAISCATNGDCLAGLGDASCGSATCDDGSCSFTYAPEGTALPDQEQTSGDCRQKVCDGSGGVQDSPDTTDAPMQTDGDCRKSTCNASGGIDQVADDTDLPVAADGTSNECVTPSCSAGSPSSPPKAAGTLCTTGGRYCNGGGTCVYCAPLDAACDAPGPATATNDTEGTAYDEGAIGNDDTSGKEECGAFTSNGDVDWYHYEGNTETVLFGSPYENDPAGAVSSPVQVTLCIYMTCTEGATGDFVCPSDTTVANAGGHDGCCKTGIDPGMDIRHVCQDAGVWMSVTAADATTCAPYDFSFHY